jgi:FMN hydrolase / 5-amino-6-(5-phospho-D-ribitylamino)uracil phosphatase
MPSKLPDIPGLSVLSLDLDDTLWDIAPVIAGAERALGDWLRRHCPRVPARWSPHRLRELRDGLSDAHPEQAHDLTWLRLRTLELALEDCGYSPSLAGDAFTVFLDARHQVTLHADVVPALEALQRRYTLVALTNGNADLVRIGLDRYFSHSLTARDVGAAKPDARMFDAVAEATGVAPERTLHVGDDPLRDVVGAARVGMRTGWLNRRSEAWPSLHPPPDAHLQDLGVLARWLLRAGSTRRT